MEISGRMNDENDQQMSNNVHTQGLNLNYFKSENPKLAIENDLKYHGKTHLMTLALLRFEIESIIDPCLNSGEMISEEVRNYLEGKRDELNKLQKNLSTMFSNGQLNSAKYLQVVKKMKTLNTELLQDISNNSVADTHRIRLRLRILDQEAQEHQEQANNQTMNIESQAPESMGVSGFFSKIDRLPPQSLAKLIQKRNSQYWNLANFISEQVLPHQEAEDQAGTRDRLQNFFYPLITKATQYAGELEQGVKPPDAARFFRKEMLEMSPALIHGKSLEERNQDLQKLIEKIEDCIKHEEEYINTLKQTLDDPDQPSGLNGKKMKEAEKTIAKYNEYIETLSKLSSQKFAWMPTPKVSIANEQRLVNLNNSEIPGNSLLVEFKRLSNLERGYYWIRWGVETQDQYVSYETDYCDNKTLTFNYQQMVEMTSKLRMDSSIESKEIRVEVLYKRFLYFNECKNSEGSIPLVDFRKTNVIQGKIKLNGSDAELHYALKIKQPINKNSRIEVPTVHAFQIFPIFNKDNVGPQQINPQVSRAATASSQSQKRPPNSLQSSISSVTTVQENFAVPKSREPVQPERMEIISSTPSSADKKVPEKPAQTTGGGLFQKKKYPPLVLLKPDVDPLASMTSDEIPEGLSLEDVINPGNPEKIESVTVLKRLAEELERARSELAGEGRKADNRFVSDNWSKALRKATILETKFGEGEVDPLEYVAKLKEVLDTDVKLIKLYEKKGDAERLEFVKETMKIMEGEIQEIEEGMAGEA